MTRRASRKKTTRRTASRKKNAVVIPRIPPTVLLRGGLLLLALFCVGAAGYALTRLEQPARAVYDDPNEYPARIVWADVPAWADDPDFARNFPGLTDSLRRLAEQRISVAPTFRLYADSEQLARVTESIYKQARRCPWLADVRQVRVRADQAILIDAAFRRPLTFLVSGEKAFLVDERGVQLTDGIPATDVRRDVGPLVIEGADARPPGPGRQWPGEDVQAGLALVATLQTAELGSRTSYRSYLRAVDLGAYDPVIDGPLLIATDWRGLHITWGRPPGEEYEIELPAERKLAYLQNDLRTVLQYLRERNSGTMLNGYLDFRDEGLVFDARGR